MLATTLVFDTILRLIFKNLENHSILIFGLTIDDGPMVLLSKNYLFVAFIKNTFNIDVYLNCWAGNEVRAEFNVCAKSEHLDNCTDPACAKLCVDKYGGQFHRDANGFCQPPSTCACTYLCSNVPSAAH